MQDAPLIVSVSGIRGIVGKSLTPSVAMMFASCYGTSLAGKTVVVSRDGRSTGLSLCHAVIAGLSAVGCHVVDIGIASTPSSAYYVKSTGAAGGIQITASHNPPEWNGMKLFRKEGFVLSPADGQRIADDYGACKFTLAPWNQVGTIETIVNASMHHLEKVVSLVDADLIRKRKFKVILDANHGSGGVFGRQLLEMLGCQCEVLGEVSDGQFEHMPEPTQENLAGFCEVVRSSGADIGFAVDPDADRLALVDENGTYLGEEYTLALAIRHVTATRKGTVVINSSTSRVSEQVGQEAGCKVFRSKVGEVHVAERMILENAVIGGEGNGGVIDPRVGYGRDSAIGMALTLEMLAKEAKPISAIMKTMPRFAIRKEKITIEKSELQTLFTKLVDQFRDATADQGDGLRLDWPDAWLQIRASNTEPIARIIAEAKTDEQAQRLCEKVRSATTQ